MKNRLPAAVTAALVLVAGLAGAALAATETAADDFSSGGYAGSTGTMEWAGNWIEVGESNGPGSGAVQVKADTICGSGRCLTIEQILGGLSSIGAMRSLDLSTATSASLTYRIGFPSGLLLDGRAVVEARAGNGGWSQLRSHEAGTEGNFTVDLPVGDTVAIRFRAVDLALTARMGFDDVEVEVALPDATTTTTTSSTTTTTTTTTTTSTRSSSTTTAPATATPTPSPTSTLSTIEQGGDPATSPTTPVGEPTPTTFDRDRPSDDPDAPATTLEPPVGEGAGSTTTTTGGDDDGAGPADSSTTIAGTTAELDRGAAAVVTQLDPRFRSDRVGALAAQEDLLVIFGLAVEDIALDILASAALGLGLAWVSLRRLG